MEENLVNTNSIMSYLMSYFKDVTNPYVTNEKKESDRLLLWIIGNVITSTNDSDDDITSIRISLSEVKYPTDKFYLKMYINRINITQYDSKYVSKDKLYDILKIVLDYFEKN